MSEQTNLYPATTTKSTLAVATQAAVSPHAGYFALKRTLDFCAAFAGLLLCTPLLLLVAFLIRRGDRGPVFHRRRVLEKQTWQAEKTPRTFDAFKFRTMVLNADTVLENNPDLRREYEKNFKLSRDPRVTPFGEKLRRSSLDELPQLVNVLRGQMSLVGPRMISPPELARYGPYAARLLSVKPGLTGLWQVSGRTELSYDERVRLDMWYIQNRSFWFDLLILARTLKAVLKRQGAV